MMILQVLEAFKVSFAKIRYRKRVERSVLRVAYLWRMWVKKNGGHVLDIHCNRMRSALTFTGASAYHDAERKALQKCLKPFIEEHVYRTIHIK
jgi:hypothetical protein